MKDDVMELKPSKEQRVAKYEQKFIVINKKRFDELNECMPQNHIGLTQHPSVIELYTALRRFSLSYEDEVDKKLDQKYYVVNQDEPYADNVIKFILDNEAQKEQIDGQ